MSSSTTFAPGSSRVRLSIRTWGGLAVLAALSALGGGLSTRLFVPAPISMETLAQYVEQQAPYVRDREGISTALTDLQNAIRGLRETTGKMGAEQSAQRVKVALIEGGLGVVQAKLGPAWEKRWPIIMERLRRIDETVAQCRR